uniref:Uncharacterized protein n=1 Tax=Arundo donax TaxID=35708 RepID=A0A0A8YD86_ARUDO
MVPEASAPP